MKQEQDADNCSFIWVIHSRHNTVTQQRQHIWQISFSDTPFPTVSTDDCTEKAVVMIGCCRNQHFRLLEHLPPPVICIVPGTSQLQTLVTPARGGQFVNKIGEFIQLQYWFLLMVTQSGASRVNAKVLLELNGQTRLNTELINISLTSKHLKLLQQSYK